MEKPSPKMSAVDSLENYTSTEVDIEGFDGLVTTTFASALNKLTEEDESDMFDEMNSLMRRRWPLVRLLFQHQSKIQFFRHRLECQPAHH